MAVNTINLTAPNDWSAAQEDIARRRRMAEMLQAQALQPAERFSTNGIEAPISWTQGLAKMLQAYQGGQGQREATEAQKALGQRYQKEGADTLARGLKAYMGTPENAPEDGVGPVLPATPGNLPEAMSILGSHPMTQGASQTILAQMLKGEETKAYKPGDVLYRGNRKVGAIPATPKEHVINGKVFESSGDGLRELGGPGQPVDYNKPFLPDGSPNPAYQDYALRKSSAGAARVSVDNRAQGKYAEVVGGKSAENDVAQFDTAQAARENAIKLDETLNVLKKSDVITGMGADILKNVERVKVLLANNKKAGKKVSDTEYLNALLGSDVFPMIKELGVGARGLDTPEEREFLREVMSGTISMNKDTLIRLAETRRNIAQRSMDRWNNRVKSGELDDFFKYANRPKSTIDYMPSDGSKNPSSNVRVVDW